MLLTMRLLLAAQVAAMLVLCPPASAQYLYGMGAGLGPRGMGMGRGMGPMDYQAVWQQLLASGSKITR